MSSLTELIHERCPLGVAYTRIADISTVLRGKRLTKNELTIAGAFPVFHGGLEPLGFYSQKNREADTTMVINVGASAGTVGFCERDFWSSDGCFCISHSEHALSKYVYYVLVNQQSFLMSKVRKAGIPTLDAKVVENLQIPLPPLAVQQEIVRILDSFTELTAELTSELTSELTARRKQYEHYRDELLTFGDDVPFVKLGDSCHVITKGTTPKAYTQSGVTFIKTEAIDGNSLNYSKLSYIDVETHNTTLKRSILKTDDILITIAGATIGKCAMVPEKLLPANTNQALAIVRLNETVCKKYIFYILQSHYMKEYINASAKGSAQPNLNLEQLNNFKFPLPPLAEQKRIVETLERFDAICNDLTSGLPAEITARQKQYEYYRGKLLTFKELDT